MQKLFETSLFGYVAEHDGGIVHESACRDGPGMGILDRGMRSAGGHTHTGRRLFGLWMGSLLTEYANRGKQNQK